MNRDKKIPDNFQTRFTLVELLVVIFIISLLAGMLLPVLGKAQGKARQIQCSNIEKQIGLCFRMYIDDEGYWPFPSLDYGPPIITWSSIFITRDYLPKHDAYRFAKSLRCAGNRVTRPDENTYLMLGPGKSWAGCDGIPGKKDSQVKRPSQTICLTENGASLQVNGIDYDINDHRYLPGGSLTDKISAIHFDGINNLFCDGHVSWCFFCKFYSVNDTEAIEVWKKYFNVTLR